MDDIEDIYELSPVQQGMLFQSLTSHRSDMHFEQVCLELQGQLDQSAWRTAWEHIVRHYDVLRTSFHIDDLAKPLQVVHHTVALPWKTENWNDVPLIQQRAYFASFLAADRNEPFDLTQVPLMRMTLISTSPRSFYFVWSHHHLLLDGWSLPIILTGVLDVYTALTHHMPVQLPPSRPYRDYIAWLHTNTYQDDGATFWQEMLADFTPASVVSHKRIGFDEYASQMRYGEQRFVVPAQTTAALIACSQRYRLTLSTMVQAAWALVLARFSYTDDILFGTTVSGRPSDIDAIESAVGLFINTLPVRIKIDRSQSLIAWLKEIHLRLFAMRDYSHTPMNRILELSRLPQGALPFETILVFENYPGNDVLRSPDSDLELKEIQVIGGKTHFPLAIQIDPGEHLKTLAIFDQQAIAAATVTQMLAQFRLFLEEVVADPDRPLSAFSALHQRQVTLVTLASIDPLPHLLTLWSRTLDLSLHLRTIGWLDERSAEGTEDWLMLIVRPEDIGDDEEHYVKALLQSLRNARNRSTEAVLCVYPSIPTSALRSLEFRLDTLLARQAEGLPVRLLHSAERLPPEVAHDQAMAIMSHCMIQMMVDHISTLETDHRNSMLSATERDIAEARSRLFSELNTKLHDGIDLVAALSQQDISSDTLHSYVAPRTPTEQLLTDIWKDLLGVEQIGIHDAFFDVGGYSLLAMQIISRIRATFAVDIPLNVLFMGRLTIAKLAEAVELHLLEQADEDELNQQLAELSQLSDDEVRRLLEQA